MKLTFKIDDEEQRSFLVIPVIRQFTNKLEFDVLRNDNHTYRYIPKNSYNYHRTIFWFLVVIYMTSSSWKITGLVFPLRSFNWVNTDYSIVKPLDRLTRLRSAILKFLLNFHLVSILFIRKGFFIDCPSESQLSVRLWL